MSAHPQGAGLNDLSGDFRDRVANYVLDLWHNGHYIVQYDSLGTACLILWAGRNEKGGHLSFIKSWDGPL